MIHTAYDVMKEFLITDADLDVLTTIIKRLKMANTAPYNNN